MNLIYKNIVILIHDRYQDTQFLKGLISYGFLFLAKYSMNNFIALHNNSYRMTFFNKSGFYAYIYNAKETKFT